MDYILIKSPETMALRGAIAIALGVVALLLPGPTFLALAIAFGAFAFADGVLALVALSHRRTRLSKGWLALEAAAGIVVGLITFFRPGLEIDRHATARLERRRQTTANRQRSQ
jgi:uncharacterized membrane protein HdeD (DUF308 family)